MIVKPKVRGFVCVTAHPLGCAAHVQEQIEYAQSQPSLEKGPSKVLVIGSSTGYGLSSRIISAFSCKAATLGVFFERPSTNGRTASAGWYNTVAFEKAAREAGLYAKSVNGDAFGSEVKEQVAQMIADELGQVDLVVYSLASPRRTDPTDGETYKSVLKPVGQDFKAKTVDTDKHLVHEVELEPANQAEVDATVKVMGGEDWALWMDLLLEKKLLAPGAKTVAYSYIGPEVTWPVYRDGTIGQAKQHLDKTAIELNERLQKEIDGGAWVSVNKAVVTQASSAIPVVPLYLSALIKIMKAKGNHEGCIEQIYRLFNARLYGGELQLDDESRIRIDDWELGEDVQAAVMELWPDLTTESLRELTDYDNYGEEFLKLFGFGIEGVDYEADVTIELDLED